MTGIQTAGLWEAGGNGGAHGRPRDDCRADFLDTSPTWPDHNMSSVVAMATTNLLSLNWSSLMKFSDKEQGGLIKEGNRTKGEAGRVRC